MKKIFGLVFMSAILSACNSSTLSLSEVENVPDDIQDSVNFDVQLQFIMDGNNNYYVVLHSSGDVAADVESEGDTVIVKLDETNLEDDVVMQNTFYLTTAQENHELNIELNGEPTSIDVMTIRN